MKTHRRDAEYALTLKWGPFSYRSSNNHNHNACLNLVLFFSSAQSEMTRWCLQRGGGAAEQRSWGQRSVLLWSNSLSSQSGLWMALVNKQAWGSSMGGVVGRKLRHCFSGRSGPETSQEAVFKTLDRKAPKNTSPGLSIQNPALQRSQEWQEIWFHRGQEAWQKWVSLCLLSP